MLASIASGLGLLAATGLSAPGATAPTAETKAIIATLPPYAATSHVHGVIHLWGHGSFKRDFMGPLVDRWMSAFQHEQPGVTLDYRMYGTASGIGALATGSANLVLLGEEISPDADRLFRRAKGYAPTKIEFANGSLDTNYFDYAHMIFVNRANPLTSLSVRQLAGIFGAGNRCGPGNIREWGQLGLKGRWAHRPITPYSWKTDIDFALFFQERVLCADHRWNPAVHEFDTVTRADGTPLEHGRQILEALSRDPNGIAISNTRFAGPDVKQLALSWSSSEPYIVANDATLIERKYPLGRYIPAFVDVAPGGHVDPVVAEFLRFVLSQEGQSILIELSGYLPLSARQADHERGLLR